MFRRKRDYKIKIIGIILILFFGYIFYLLPKWVFWTFIGITLITIGWVLYDC